MNLSPGDRYSPAAVCRRGHVETGDTTKWPFSKRCPECGAQILTACPTCGSRIRGYTEHYTSVMDYKPPSFCDSCGGPFPWVDRKGRIYQLENILDDEDLDEATRLKVRESLEALQRSDLSEDEESRLWKRVKALSPGLMDAGGRIIESLVSGAIRAQLGL
jgi:hypothetical protein